MEIPKFQYKAVNMDGQVMEGVLESYDYDGVIEIIRSKSFYPLEIKELYEKRDFRELDLWGNISSKDLSIFCKQFASMLKAGVPISEALDILADHTTNRKLKNSLRNINRLIYTGKTLTESLSIQGKCFPNFLIRIIEASEISGSLDASLERMAIYFQKQYTLTQKLKKSITYPVILAVTAIFVMFFLIQIVVPQFVKIFQSYAIELPLPTRLLLGIYNFTLSYGTLLLIFPFIIYIILIFMRKKQQNRTRLHAAVLKLPVLGKIIQKALAARFNRILAMLIASGVPLTYALDITVRAISNAYIEQVLKVVIEEVRKGKGLGYSLRRFSLFPPSISRMISIGEESGQLEEMMENIADFYEIEVESLVERIITLLEPLMILILGGLIAIIVLAVVMPIFDIFRFAV